MRGHFYVLILSVAAAAFAASASCASDDGTSFPVVPSSAGPVASGTTEGDPTPGTGGTGTGNGSDLADGGVGATADGGFVMDAGTYLDAFSFPEDAFSFPQDAF